MSNRLQLFSYHHCLSSEINFKSTWIFFEMIIWVCFIINTQLFLQWKYQFCSILQKKKKKNAKSMQINFEEGSILMKIYVRGIIKSIHWCHYPKAPSRVPTYWTDSWNQLFSHSVIIMLESYPHSIKIREIKL